MLGQILVLFLFLSCSTQREQIVVFAASSLQYILRDEQSELYNQIPNTDVLFQFSGSHTLALQIEHGAPADLFLSAHPDLMIDLQGKNLLLGDPISFGGNQLVIVQSTAFPQLNSFEELPQAQSIVLGHELSPIGIYTDEFLQNMPEEWQEELQKKVVSKQTNVALLRSQVLLGEVHCAIVYRSDAQSTKLPFLQIPDKFQPSIDYQIAYIKKEPNHIQPQTRQWVRLFLSHIEHK